MHIRDDNVNFFSFVHSIVWVWRTNRSSSSSSTWRCFFSFAVRVLGSCALDECKREWCVLYCVLQTLMDALRYENASTPSFRTRDEQNIIAQTHVRTFPSIVHMRLTPHTATVSILYLFIFGFVLMISTNHGTDGPSRENQLSKLNRKTVPFRSECGEWSCREALQPMYLFECQQ